MINSPKPRVTIHTDGSCIKNPGKGGYAAILSFGEKVKYITGFHPYTTNNRMELMACIAALEILKIPCIVELYTDSKYVLAVINRILIGKTRKKGQFPNYDLQERLKESLRSHDVIGNWVKGHGDNNLNNIADELASSAARGVEIPLNL